MDVQEHHHGPYRCLVAYTYTGGEQISSSVTSKMEKALFAYMNTVFFVKDYLLTKIKYKDSWEHLHVPIEAK